VQRFGTDGFDIIEADSRRLREIDGIGPKRAARIASAWADQKVIREIMVFLHSHGVGTARAVRIFKTYGADAVQVMSENPYRLAKDIRGIGFRTADAIARKLGIESTATIRLRAGIAFALTEAMGDGHCGLPREAPIGLAGKLLEVPADLIAAALALELAEGNVTADTLSDTPCVFLTGLHQAERSLSGHLKRIGAGPLPWQAIDADRSAAMDRGKDRHDARGHPRLRPCAWPSLPRCWRSPAGRASARPPSSTRSCAFWRRRASGYGSARRPG
jgi:exodeoxyribonuclease V alpha subunit